MDIMNDKKRKLLEIDQGKRIHDDAEKIWGWETSAGKLRVERRVNEMLTKMGDVTNGKKVLELGCGTGVFTAEFSKKGVNLVSFDISYELLKSAKDKAKTNMLLVGDAEYLPFKNEIFDCVIGVSVLHHLDINKVLEEIKAVLKKGGKVIFSEPNMANPQIFILKNVPWFKKLMHDTPTETAFYRNRFSLSLQKRGFIGVCIRPFDFLHPFAPVFLINFIQRLGLFLERTPLVKEVAGSLLIYAQKE